MRRIVSIVLSLLILAGMSAFTSGVSAAESPIVLYEMRPSDGGVIPFAKGRNADCYYPDAERSGKYGTPEMYPFGTCNLSMDGGFVKMTPKTSEWSTIVFDTVPKELYINDWNHKYLSFMVCSDSAFKGKVKLVDLGGRYQKLFDTDFTGKWQRIVLDISGTDGWYSKDADGKFTVPATVAPYSKEGNNFFGGFKFSLTGTSAAKSYHFDYFGLFSDKATAESYSVLANEGEAFQKLDEEKIEGGFKIVSGIDEENTAVLYNMRVNLGEEIPFAKGRNSDCYFPDAERSGKYGTPEMYTFGSAKLEMTQLGYTKFIPISKEWATIVFDTVPKEMYTNDWEHKYMSFMVCSEKAFSGQVKLEDLGGKCQKIIPVDFTGKWQRITIDLSEVNGWYSKDEGGAFTVPMTYSPYSKEGNSFFGGFKFYLTGNSKCNYYYIDYFGLFADKAKADAFSVMAKEGESVSASLMEEGKEVMEAVKFYQDKKGDDFLYELRPAYGKEVPYGISRYAPTKCYYPLGKGGDTERPEMYTWGTGEICVDGDYVKFTPAKTEPMRITFDTSPSTYYMDYAKPYFTMVIKTSRAFEGSIGFKTLDSLYQKFFPVSFTGEWQKIILDLSDPNGWEKRDENKVYYLYNQTPFSKEINKLYGGHQMTLAGTNETEYFLFDYIMMFDTLEKAQSFKGLAEVEDSAFSEVEERRTIMSAKSRPSNYFMTGYTDGTFKPNQGMTRAEAATVIARLMDSERVISEERPTSFTDMPMTEWYYKYVSYLEKYGINKGVFEGEFKGAQPITRAEFVKLCANAGAFDPAKVQNVTKSFSDVNDGTQFKTEILAAAESGIINGYSDGTFGPSKTLTRAEITTILTRILGIEERKDKPQKFSDLDASHWAYGIIMAVVSTADYEAGTAKIAEVDALTEKRIEEIRNSPTTVVPGEGGTAYYVSVSGNDANDGKTPETAWQSLEKVSKHTYNKGDVVYFKRGDIFRIPADKDVLRITQGVSYSAYGEGDKPKIYGSPENGADPSMWTLYDKEHNIWRYERQMIDQGTLIFNGGEKWAKTQRMYFRNGRFCNADSTAFDMKKSLSENLSMFCETIPENNVPVPSTTKGYLYLRCDDGNPGEVFDSIEFMPSRHMIKAQNNPYGFKDTVIENLCVMYGGSHGIHASTVDNFTVRNCEFGFIGGGHQSFSDTTSIGSTGGRGVRFGNAIETGYGDGYYVYNNYIYQCYDCGITFQSTNRDVTVTNVHFDNNVIEKCQYSIEYWVDPADKDITKYYIGDYTINNNIMREAGVGISQLRPDKGGAAHIKGWTKYNAVKDNSYVISGNIFDRSRDMMVHIGLPALTAETSKPVMKDNVWIQYYSTEENNSSFGEYERSGVQLSYNDDILVTFKKYGILDTSVYYVK